MASVVIEKLPKVSTSTVPKIPFPQEPSSDIVAQLEHNIKFLQERYQETLAGLHNEIDTLCQKNRDLQFQLVFQEESASVPISSSSPEDNETGFVKPKNSPVNVAPSQVELLEKDLQDMKISLEDMKVSLQEAKTQNQYLSEIVEQQKKKLDSSMEQKAIKQSVTDVGIQVDCFRLNQTEKEVLRRPVESMLKSLMKRNEDQGKEIEKLKKELEIVASVNKGGRSRVSNKGHHNRVSSTSSTQEQIPHKFPPLQNQSRTSRNGRNRHHKQYHQSEVDFTMLPQLQSLT
ncbi:uncharacterized protein LOC144474689 [Augochlora pura]